MHYWSLFFLKYRKETPVILQKASLEQMRYYLEQTRHLLKIKIYYLHIILFDSDFFMFSRTSEIVNIRFESFEKIS